MVTSRANCIMYEPFTMFLQVHPEVVKNNIKKILKHIE